MLPGVRRLLRTSQSKRLQLRLAEALDQLRRFGYRVFHDLRRDGYDLDHVIVGPTGVFAIETKLRSGDPKIESPSLENGSKEKGSAESGCKNAFKVNPIIKENCEFDGWVWPLMIIAGEWRVKNDLQSPGARLFAINKLVNHIVSQPSCLTSTEIKLIAAHLEPSVKLNVKLRKKKPPERRRK
jgi:hypothetical protein